MEPRTASTAKTQPASEEPRDSKRISTAVAYLKSLRGTFEGLTLDQITSDRHERHRF